MEANEMQKYDIYALSQSRLVVSAQDDGEWVRYSDAMEVIQTLQAEIDGMIEKPTAELEQMSNQELIDTANMFIEDGDEIPVFTTIGFVHQKEVFAEVTNRLFAITQESTTDDEEQTA